ncbi:MAG: carboxylating nicotinate-nucleotide diphosphorylase [bacterium]|nr:carboxylating nicotinate-nucleotide diphosphorylase [bacterium]
MRPTEGAALPPLDAGDLRRVVRAALDEDLGHTGDATTSAVVPEATRGTGRLVAREDLVLAGLPVAREVFRTLDPELEFRMLRVDGERVPAGEVVALVTGRARPILEGERSALNFLMRMSGVASAARRAVDEIDGTGAVVLDTRKTVPGLRALDKYAVAAGGATNHRMGLYDAVMIKDTHLAVLPSIGDAVAAALAAGNEASSITVEVRDAEQLREAIEAGAGRALLDNMDLDGLSRCVASAGGRIVLEASGGLTPGRLRAVAETGVDCLSIGWLTHSAAAADLALETTLEAAS